VDETARGAVEETAELLRGLGHEVRERDPAYGLVGNGVAALYLRGIHDDVRGVPRPEELEPRTRGFGRLGSLVTRRSLRWARDAIPRHAARINRLLADSTCFSRPPPGPRPSRWGDGRGGVRFAPCSE
jgi:amidase